MVQDTSELPQKDGRVKRMHAETLEKDLGATEKVAIFFDDDKSSIKEQVAYARRKGYRTEVTQDIKQVFGFMRTLGSRAAFFLDMCVPSVVSMKDIGKPKISTLNGVSVAPALLRALLSVEGKRLKYPVILTGRDIEPDAEDSLLDLAEEDVNAKVIKKDEFEKFAEVIDLHAGEIDRLLVATDTQLDAVNKMYSELASDPSEIASVLGFGASSEVDVVSANRKIADLLRSGYVDVRARLDALVFIKDRLIRLMGVDDIESQRDWLLAEDPHLDNRAPWDCIKSGNMEDLIRVAAFLNRIVG